MYTPEQIEKVCERIENGSEGIRAILSELGMAPSHFWRTIEAVESARDRYVRAKERQAELLADEIIEIADDKSGDTTRNERGDEIMDSEFVQRARLRVESRKWVAAKLLPKRYGERLDVTSGGEPMKAYVVFDPEKDV